MTKARLALLLANVLAAASLSANVAQAADETGPTCCRQDVDKAWHCCASTFCCNTTEPSCKTNKECAGGEE